MIEKNRSHDVGEGGGEEQSGIIILTHSSKLSALFWKLKNMATILVTSAVSQPEMSCSNSLHFLNMLDIVVTCEVICSVVNSG